MAGSSMQLSSSDQGGMAFGMAQKLRIANVLMQPNGRGNTAGQLSMSGVSIGSEGGPWGGGGGKESCPRGTLKKGMDCRPGQSARAVQHHC